MPLLQILYKNSRFDWQQALNIYVSEITAFILSVEVVIGPQDVWWDANLDSPVHVLFSS